MSFDFSVDSEDGLGIRASRLSGSIKAEFPQRVEVNNDLNNFLKLEGIATDLKVKIHPSTIYEVKRRYEPDTLLKLARSNLTLGKEKRKIERLRDIRHDAIRLFDAVIPEGTSISDNLNFRLLTLQEGFEVVQIYDSYDLSPDRLKERIKASLEYMAENSINEKSKVYLVNTSVYQSPTILRDKLQLIYSELDGSSSRYVPSRSARRQYRVFRQFSGVEKWKHLSDVPKIWKGNSRTSLLHIMPFFGFDSVSPYVAPPIRNKELRELLNNLPVVLKRFDTRETAHLLLDELEQRYGNVLDCYCEPEQGKNLAELKDENSPEQLKIIFKSHEPYGSNMELASMRGLIGVGNELFKKYSNREFVTEPFRKLLGIDVLQMRI